MEPALRTLVLQVEEVSIGAILKGPPAHHCRWGLAWSGSGVFKIVNNTPTIESCSSASFHSLVIWLLRKLCIADLVPPPPLNIPINVALALGLSRWWKEVTRCSMALGLWA